MKKLAFCDIDGTILDGSRKMEKLTPETLHAVSSLKQTDYVVIASGRCMGLLDRQIIDLDPSGFILCNGGYDLVGDHTVFCDSFSEEAVRKIREVTLAYNGFYIFETLHEMYIDSMESEAFQKFMSGWARLLKGFTENGCVDKPFHIAMIGFPDEPSCIAAGEQLKDVADLARHKGFYSYDVNIKGISKATGVNRIREYLDIPYENTYAFGDALNDLEMLQAVAHPVIMKNSDPALRSYGFEETDDVLDNGFYRYLLANELINPL
ncbi:MAG: HAD family phosphatase [Erysipelotrichaceae bacterium]|nr:HAD family phosphatase [Erysipelotrichaceae bacterium]